jgi:FixJ family two-component response regulator
MNEKETVFLVDDDLSVHRAFSRLLRTYGFNVEAFCSAREFLEHGRFRGKGCLILDVNLPELSGLDLQDEMNRRGISFPIIFISAFGDIPMTVRAMKGGALDFLTKPVSADDLVKAIRDALAKQAQEWGELSVLEERKSLVDSLTTRQNEVLRRLIGGMLNKQIASALGISEKTVKFQRGELMKRLGAESLAEVVRLAEQVGIEPLRND